MITYNLSKDQHTKIMRFAHRDAHVDIKRYIQQYFHGDFSWNEHTSSREPGYWGSIDFSRKEYLTLFLIRWG